MPPLRAQLLIYISLLKGRFTLRLLDTVLHKFTLATRKYAPLEKRDEEEVDPKGMGFPFEIRRFHSNPAGDRKWLLLQLIRLTIFHCDD